MTTNFKTLKTVPKESKYVEHKLKHCQQCYNWDCGIACTMMLLSLEQRENMRENFWKICQDEGFEQSTWTIDLCYLLVRFGIEHCMYTTIKGVSNTQASCDKLDYKTRKRVERRFQNADEAGILIYIQELGSEKLLSHIETRGPAIVLVDAALLVCDLCKHNKLRAEFRRAFGGPYRGHYVVVVGYAGGKILYRDPALSPRLCATSPGRLHNARRSPGTDFDAILIFKDFR
ncbi:unnamed protein product, partial [Iphiclides podalirius]